MKGEDEKTDEAEGERGCFSDDESRDTRGSIKKL